MAPSLIRKIAEKLKALFSRAEKAQQQIVNVHIKIKNMLDKIPEPDFKKVVAELESIEKEQSNEKH